MPIFTDIKLLQKFIKETRYQGKSVGFVPTMGALHKGHLELVRRAVDENDLVICSVYVNPTQFNNSDDLEKYPRTLEQDTGLLTDAGCDVIFTPSDKVMYPDHVGDVMSLGFGALDQRIEGKFRPGHFSGVGLVVSKLFHIVSPDRAYFGQKDLQQVAVIRKLVRDLFFNLEIVTVPIVREENGLAMSSRNARLSPEQREVAAHLFQALKVARDYLASHPAEVKKAIQQATNHLAPFEEIKLEYLEVLDADDFGIVSEVTQCENAAICIAAFVGDVRLIDNILL